MNFPIDSWQTRLYNNNGIGRRKKFNLKWWSPTEGCTSTSRYSKETWIKAVGIPLQLWSHKVFQVIGEVCGEWLATEEETELRNHMKWARILVANEGKSILKEVAISHNGLKFCIPIWAESNPRFEILPESVRASAGEDDGGHYPVNPINQQAKQGNFCNKTNIPSF